MKNVFKSLVLFVALVGWVPIAHAAVVYVDFGIASQVTAGNWNNISGVNAGDQPTVNIGNLVDNTGVNTGWGLNVSKTAGNANFGVAGTGANWDGPYPSSIASLPQSALRDGLFLSENGKVGLITFSNLNPLKTYDILLYGARGNNGANATYTIGVAAVPGASGTIANVYQNSTVTIQFNEVAPTAGGQIRIDWTSSNSGSAAGSALNFIQFGETVIIPEPGSMALLVLGTGVLLMFRCRFSPAVQRKG
jgi:hypothetical protein